MAEAPVPDVRDRVAVAAILASHNRREKTLACLASYFGQAIDPSVRLRAVLVDDASSDGTGAAVRERFPDVEVMEGSGNLFWAGAMALAERTAMKHPLDFLLWLNDDVLLDREALRLLMDTSRRTGGESIAVGAMRDPAGGGLTYSGVRRTGRHPLRMTPVPPGDEPVEAETFNGNAVLIPRRVRERVGPVDAGLVHSAADHDYGLRARRMGISSFVAPGMVGSCERDGGRQPWLDTGLSLGERLELFLGPKGFPPRPRARYLRRHGGLAWPVLWTWTYLRRLPPILWRQASAGRA
jgi:GT2 family glycosyltransferase